MPELGSYWARPIGNQLRVIPNLEDSKIIALHLDTGERPQDRTLFSDVIDELEMHPHSFSASFNAVFFSSRLALLNLSLRSLLPGAGKQQGQRMPPGPMVRCFFIEAMLLL